MRSGSAAPLLKRVLPWVVTLGTVALLTLVLDGADWRQLPRAFAWPGMVLGLGCYGAVYFVVAMRWRLLLMPQAPLGASLPRLFAISALHNFYNLALPARTGELTILLLAQRHLGTTKAHAGAGLLLARLFDVAAVGLAGAVLFLAAMPALGERATPLVLAMVLTCLLACIGVAWLLAKGQALAIKLETQAGREAGFKARLFIFVAEVARRAGRRQPTGLYGRLLACSLALILLRAALFASLLIFAHPPLGLLGAMLVGLTTVAMTMTPLQGFLATGTFQAGWVLGYTLLGGDAETGLLQAVAAHGLLLALMTVFVALGMGILRR